MATRTRRTRKAFESVIPKERLAAAVAQILDDENLTQTEAAWRMKDSPSQLSLVATGKIRGFSAERLVSMLLKLGRDVDIVVRPTAKGAAGKVRVTVR